MFCMLTWRDVSLQVVCGWWASLHQRPGGTAVGAPEDGFGADEETLETADPSTKLPECDSVWK